MQTNSAKQVFFTQLTNEAVMFPDNYVSNLLEQEKLETLTQLILDGYDKLDAVLEKVSTEGLPETVTDFVNSIPEQKVQ